MGLGSSFRSFWISFRGVFFWDGDFLYKSGIGKWDSNNHIKGVFNLLFRNGLIIREIFLMGDFFGVVGRDRSEFVRIWA